MTEDYMQEQYVTDHVIDNHDLQYHVTTEDYMKDHPEG